MAIATNLPVDRVAKYLTKNGITCDVGYSLDPEIEDDEVRIDGNLNVQVGSMSKTIRAHVVRTSGGTFTFGPERTTLAVILRDVRVALGG